jgi:glucuronoarabinoxylan endo-1,4-beta-xylanase
VPQTFSLNGFSTNAVTPWITSASLSLAAQAPVSVSGSSFTYTLPASSVTTFYGTATEAHH